MEDPGFLLWGPPTSSLVQRDKTFRNHLCPPFAPLVPGTLLFTTRPLKGFPSLLPPCPSPVYSVPQVFAELVNYALAGSLSPSTGILCLLSSFLFCQPACLSPGPSIRPTFSLPPSFLSVLLSLHYMSSIATISCQLYCSLLLPLLFVFSDYEDWFLVKALCQVSYVGEIFL